MAIDTAFREKVTATLRALKSTPPDQIGAASLPLVRGGERVGRLRPLTFDSFNSDDDIRLLANWRQAATHWYPTQFQVTREGTRRWLDSGMNALEDRILFMIELADGRPVGHLGLGLFNWERRACEIENIVRGVQGVVPGLITLAVTALLRWTFDTLGNDTVFLRVFADNPRAIKLYREVGFREIRLTPLVPTQDGEILRWVPAPHDWWLEIERSLMTMRLDRGDLVKNPR
jgi:RimJ/RimL family protein N-acetyltransferase